MRSDAAKRQHWASADARIGEELDAGGNHVDWLIDNCEAYESMLDSVCNARESIWISQLAFDADCTALADGPEEPSADAGGKNLLDAILAASGQHGVGVRILLNSSLLLNTKRPLLSFLVGRKPDSGLVEVRGISRFPQLLHAKMVIIDQRRAFLMGSPFVNGYWDSHAHSPIDHRRPHRELGGRPVHDVSVGVRGAVVRELAEVFTRLWNSGGRQAATQETPSARRTTRRSGTKLGVDVVTTAPGGRRGSSDPGSVETLDALLAGIECARSLIYIEHQYLSSRPVVDALRRALDREPALELILLVNQNPDVTAYRRWQNARLAESGLLVHPRVGVFGLWSASSHEGSRPAINQVFVHSKVVIIDDEWAMVGSANLDGASLDSYGDDFSGSLGRRVFRDVRNFDVSMVFTRKPAREPNPILQLRGRLWMEHLGSESVRAMERRAGLAEWKALAALNVAALNTGAASDESALSGSFILPYSSSARPRAQLEDAGVRPSAPLDLEFDPGWLEISCSPNWVRNMFL
jgi:phosphatidylserine/phosphatidylglycerophosphate/cardiolipin synthase-like enzyme